MRRPWPARWTYLLILELDKVLVVDDDLVAEVFRILEQLWQSEPLAGHLVSIVGIHELIIIDAIGGIALDTLNGGFARIEGQDVVNQGLTGRRQWEGFRWVRGIIVAFCCLAGFEMLARKRRVLGKVGITSMILGLGGHCVRQWMVISQIGGIQNAKSASPG